jgi:hypothetical protein
LPVKAYAMASVGLADEASALRAYQCRYESEKSQAFAKWHYLWGAKFVIVVVWVDD